jgi:SAM-dependent methyltransferase
MNDAMEAEFDVLARWTVEAVQRLGPDHALPAACQGSASPAGLDWLSHACGLAPGVRLLDVGGGTGGPAAYAASRSGARPLLVEPMPGACRAATRLFGLAAVVGAGEALPVATGGAEAAWCLGVLCTSPRRPALLRELRRVLRPGRPLGLLVFVRHAKRLPDAPEGNDFPSPAELHRQLDAAGLAVADRAELAELAPPPPSWVAKADRVSDAVAREHRSDPRYDQVHDQRDRMARLLADGAVTGLLVHARAT